MSGNARRSALFVGSRDSGLVEPIAPPVRLVGAMLFLLALPLLETPPALGLALAIGAVAVVAAGLPLASILRRMAVAEGFLVVMLVTLPFAISGQPLFTLFGLTGSLEGCLRAMAIVARINSGLLVTMALLGGMGSQRLASAVSGLGLPVCLATLIQMTMRYIDTFGDEYRRLRAAMLVRGFCLRNAVHTWRSLGYLVGMMLVRSCGRAERVHNAMLCRGYAGRFPTPPAPPLGRADLAFGLVVVLALAGLVALEVAS